MVTPGGRVRDARADGRECGDSGLDPWGGDGVPVVADGGFSWVRCNIPGESDLFHRSVKLPNMEIATSRPTSEDAVNKTTTTSGC